jgi:hypothetical protein
MPTKVRAPSCFQSDSPELMTTTGMPALTAALISGFWASGKKLPTTMASGFFAMAACISLASVGPEASVEVGLR